MPGVGRNVVHAAAILARGEKSDAHSHTIMKGDFGDGWNLHLRKRRRDGCRGLLCESRIIILRLPAFMTESGIGRQLDAAGTEIGHDSSLT